MKLFLQSLFVILFLAIVLSLAGLFLPRALQLEKDVWIRTSPDIVFSEVNTVTSWKKWLPWLQDSLATNYAFSEQTDGIGASVAWQGASSGTGKIRIEKAVRDKIIACQIIFDSTAMAFTRIELAPAGVGTRVRWTYSIENLDYMNRYFMALARKQLVHTFDDGLMQLKAQAELARLGRIVAVDTLHRSAQKVLMVTDSVPVNSFPLVQQNHADKLKTFAERRSANIVSSPYVVYHTSHVDTLVKFSVVLPIDKKVWGWSETQYAELPATSFVYADFAGLYSNIHLARKAMNQFAAKENLRLSNIYSEEFIITPATEMDTSKWLTRTFMQISDSE